MKKIVLLLMLIISSLVATVSPEVNQIVLNSTQTLLTNLTELIIAIIGSVITYYIREFVLTNSYVKKYNLDNEKTERLLFNAINYAEAKANKYVNDNISKRDLAISYLEKVDPNTISKYGDTIHEMLDRKVEQAKVAQTIRLKG